MDPERMNVEEAGGLKYLVLSCPEEKRPAPYKMKILREGLCPAVLPMRFLEQDGRLFFYYEQSGWMSLEQKLEREGAEPEKMLSLLQRLLRGLLQAEDMLLPAGDFPLTPADVFLKETSREKDCYHLCLLWEGGVERPSLVRRLAMLLEATERLGRCP
ncbi:MAG: DUF6382 domain-containing protein, partial [Bacillota bacterium]|nr:DUF6382 domain-containing protein [Bacillota bacterium]